MSQRVLITNFNYSVSRAEFEQTAAQLAPAFAAVPGCLWKL